jgi:hypothetical protein
VIVVTRDAPEIFLDTSSIALLAIIDSATAIPARDRRSFP